MLLTVPETALGRATTMPEKMISEMPLPIPRSEICSPSHMTKAQPVVSVSTVISRKPQPGVTTSEAPPGVVIRSSHRAMVIDWIMEMPMVR